MNRVARRKWARLIATTIIAVGALGTTTHASAQTERALHSFSNNGKDGNQPNGSLVFDKAGNLYGTTEFGGLYNNGTVFELVRSVGGGWTEKILHNFNPNGKDGIDPRGNLILDRSGNLYGTTQVGGAGSAGTVFELMPQAGGGWSERILHTFINNGKDGEWPIGGLIFDAAGNLYGTTIDGGNQSCSYGCGVVFELMPSTSGTWTEKIVHFFGSGAGGSFPGSTLISDKGGNLYGVTIQGGSGTNCLDGCGTVFELTPSAGGAWTETLLYNFAGGSADGQYPSGGLIFDASGNVYGETYEGGTYNSGTVFKLSPISGGGWSETVLYSLGALGDGANPFYGSPIFDTKGNLYGTAANTSGGTGGFGAVFGLTPAQGAWTESFLFSFDQADGWAPISGVILDANGNLYGTTAEGGASTYYGTVFEITP